MPRKYNIQCKGLNNNMIIHPFFTFFYKHSLICHLLQSPTFLQSSYLFSKHWFNTFENGLIFISKMVLNYISLYIYQCKPCQRGGALFVFVRFCQSRLALPPRVAAPVISYPDGSTKPLLGFIRCSRH